MKTHYKWHYLTLAGVLTLGGCSTSRQTAQTGEADDLYGSSTNAIVYANNSDAQPAKQTYRANRRTNDQYARNTNPDYTDGQTGDGMQADYYTDSLTTRKLQRGLSPDPGWGNAYDQGYSNGFNSALAYNNPYYNSSRWNSWGGFGANNFYGGLGLGFGLGSAFGYGLSPFGYSRFGNPFYSPFGYNNFAYSPFDYGYGGFGGFGGGYGYNSFYNPYNGYGGFGGGYGNYYGGGRTVVYNNVIVGADPYRNRTTGPRNAGSSNRYNGDFVNAAPRNPNTGGRRASDYSGSYNNSGTARNATTNGGNSAYYSRPANGSSSRGSYYYSAPATAGSARTNASGNSSSSNDTYYSRPSNNSSSRGNYTPPASNGGNSSRGSYQQQSSQSYSQPSTQSQSRSYSQPSYSAPSNNSSRGSYSAPSAPSAPSGGSSSGGSRGSVSGGGSSRGPR